MDDPRHSHGAEESPAPPDESAAPKKWWQWLLLYPGLGIALLGAIPTLVELRRSFTLDVPYGKSAEAEQQLKLWQVNFDCMNKLPVIKPIRNDKNVEVASVVCDTGDVLIVGTLPDRSKQMKWVSWNDVHDDAGGERGRGCGRGRGRHARGEERRHRQRLGRNHHLPALGEKRRAPAKDQDARRLHRSDHQRGHRRGSRQPGAVLRSFVPVA
jgi:hypothetical protein